MSEPVRIHLTPGGVRFGLVGEKGASPAPTLFIFAVDMETTLESADFAAVGHALADHGFLLASVDAPCHGKDLREGEEEGSLACWRARLERGEDLLASFTSQASAVLDYLVQEGYTDPQKVAACGTSRGAFIALHFAAADPRVRCIIAFAPLTDMCVLREFDGAQRHAATRGLSIIHKAHQLADRGVWLCIGLDDERVSTDSAIAFTRSLVEEALIQGFEPNVELHVAPPVGHTLPPGAHEAAAWLLTQMKESSR